MALTQHPIRTLLFNAGSIRFRDGFAPLTRIYFAFGGNSLMQAFDFLRISASVRQGRSQVACTSIYASKIPDKQTTRNTICPLNSALPSLSLPSLSQPVVNNKKSLRWLLLQSQLLLNWANLLSGRASRAPISIAALNRGCA